MLGCNRSVLIMVYEFSSREKKKKRQSLIYLLNFVSYFQCPAGAVFRRNLVLSEEEVM